GAARVFYEPDRFTRRGAMPKPTLKLLQDEGSVQMLDGEAHRWRKRMLMSLMTPAAIRRLGDTFEAGWRARMACWERMDEVILFEEVRGILCRAVCDWAGVPLTEQQAEARTREFGAMIDGAGAIGPRNWRGMLLRTRTERWARYLIARIRRGEAEVPEGSAADIIARHREANGDLLDVKIAAVELLNVLRPTVAVDRFMTFAALALHEHPRCRPDLDTSEGIERFVQEVRRYYPFFPFVGGRVLDDFEWSGFHFRRGMWVLLDLYGTNRDGRVWEVPEEFRPERFRHWTGSAFDFIPQGGGGHDTGHRCAGEWVTIELMKRAVGLLTTAMRYDVPDQDLQINLTRIPAIPNSRFVIRNVRASSSAPTRRVVGAVDR
ncbi:MAG TPA: cytochrome P450, partial [Alphaproteobacteria bacterium]|nr:cytochrome P450 [Alphaproteobacteria bacterium]